VLRALAAAFALTVVTACRPATVESGSITLFAMATTVELTLPAAVLSEQPELVAAIEADLLAFGRDYYAWGDGELARVNRELTQRDSVTTTPELAALLLRSQNIARTSGGAFDPGVGLLVELWGFHAATSGARDPPGASMVASAMRSGIPVTAIAISGNELRRPRAGRVLFDLGGIAKGAAVDRVVARLEAAGIAPALVNAGGDLRVVGERPDRAWRIGIQAPRAAGLLGTIELQAGEAAFTSGDYERFYERDGERLHHIIDPRSGYPATQTQAVTVIAGEGLLADATATALFVAGPGQRRELARALGITAVLRVDASGNVEMTAEMRDRFQPGDAWPSDIIAAIL
jgi:thiamine biosynthesis lipoprotein